MAFFKGSYYENTPIFSVNDKGEIIFDGLRARKLNNLEAILEHSVSQKERLDSIAHHYYGDSRDWRRIVETNPDILFPEDLMFDSEDMEENGNEKLGKVILIPRRKEI